MKCQTELFVNGRYTVLITDVTRKDKVIEPMLTCYTDVLLYSYTHVCNYIITISLYVKPVVHHLSRQTLLNTPRRRLIPATRRADPDFSRHPRDRLQSVWRVRPHRVRESGA